LKKLAFTILLGIVVSACTQVPQWTLFVSDTPIDTSVDILGEETKIRSEVLSLSQVAGYYDTLDQCQLKAEGLLRLSAISQNVEQTKSDAVHYTCASQCQLDESSVIQCQQFTQVH
jgi:hypothetical protein